MKLSIYVRRFIASEVLEDFLVECIIFFGHPNLFIFSFLIDLCLPAMLGYYIPLMKSIFMSLLTLTSILEAKLRCIGLGPCSPTVYRL